MLLDLRETPHPMVLPPPARVVDSDDRRFLALIGTGYAGVGLSLLIDHSADPEVWLPGFWPVWFMLAGLTTIAYAWRPHSTRLYSFVGASLVIGALGRSMALGFGIWHGDVAGREWRAIAHMIVWLLVAGMIRRLWRTFTPAPRGAEPWYSPTH